MSRLTPARRLPVTLGVEDLLNLHMRPAATASRGNLASVELPGNRVAALIPGRLGFSHNRTPTLRAARARRRVAPQNVAFFEQVASV